MSHILMKNDESFISYNRCLTLTLANSYITVSTPQTYKYTNHIPQGSGQRLDAPCFGVLHLNIDNLR